MPIHVAILKPPLIRQVLSGRKTMESRLTKTPRPPYGAIEGGQRIYVKASGGPYMALARAGQVVMYDNLTPRRLARLQSQYNDRVCGDPAYWQERKRCRFAVFIELHQVEPINIGPAYPRQNMVAWHVLDEKVDPIRETTVTEANLRNNYVRLEGTSHKLHQSMLELTLPDGGVVRTDFARGSMLRWRGWGRYFREHDVQSGDKVRFMAVGPHRYRVSFVTCNGESEPPFDRT